MPPSSPDVSVIIVNWNGRHHLGPCLRAVLAQRDVCAEIIVVDNASTDGSTELLRTSFPQVRLLEMAENRGFAGGNNAGVQAARGRLVALLNNDTVVDAGWLRALVDGLDERTGVVLTTSQIVYMHAPSTIDSAGDGFLRSGGAFKRLHGEPVERASRSGEVFGVCGAACLMPKAVFEELGGFDEDFFFSHEDVDLSYRARLFGYRCRYVAEAVVRHHGSGTSGRTTTFTVFHAQRNLEWIYLKNTPRDVLLRTFASHLVYTAAATVHFARIGRLGPFLRGKIAAVAGLAPMLRKRRQIQARRRVSSAELLSNMDARWMARKWREKQFDTPLVQDRP